MEDYYRCALNVLRGETLAQSPDRLAYRAPLYPLFLSGVMAVAGPALGAARWVQAFLGALTPLLLYMTVRLWLAPLRERKVASVLSNPYLAPMAAGLMLALMGEHIFFTALTMTETFYLFLLMAWTLAAAWCRRRPSLPLLIGVSAGLGLLALTRPISLVFLPIVVYLSLSSIPRERWRARLWAPMLAWLLPIAPWTIRNLVVLNAFVLITTNSGVNFYIGQHHDYSYWNTGGKETIRQEIARQHGPDEVYEDRYFFRLGLISVIEDPSGFFTRALTKLYNLFFHPEPPWPWAEYPVMRDGAMQVGLYIENDALPWFRWSPALLLLALTGMAYAAVLRLRNGLPLAMIALYLIACVIYFARTRFRLPLDPFMIYYAVLGAASLVDGILFGYGRWPVGFARPASRNAGNHTKPIED